MFIYISGPYTARGSGSREDARRETLQNVKRAEDAALELIRRGHVPLISHKMTLGWEEERGLSREIIMDVCLAWVRRCDAVLYLGSSPGADMEKNAAEKGGVPVFFSLDDVPREALAHGVNERG
jgi:hypothetical protein